MIPAERALIERTVAAELRRLIAGPILCGLMYDLGERGHEIRGEIDRALERWVGVHAAGITALIADEVGQRDARRALDAMKQREAAVP